MYEDSSVDVIYITTPHNTHYEYLSVSLCFTANMCSAEKSITLNSSELNKLKALADEKGLVLAEAMTIWHMPLYKKFWQIVESGQIGRPQMITMNFGKFQGLRYDKPFLQHFPGWRRLCRIIGVYCIEYCPKFYV